ncbi:MAG: hypothetical protein ACUZ8I_10300 [Candidatus Scalindua sp.]
MEMCMRGHDEIVYEYDCPVCELKKKMASCPVCNKNKDITKTDDQKEIERLKIQIYNLETESALNNQ